MKVTITDIARLAGVSHSTVSRVLNGAPIRIGESRKRRILDLARQFNYTPNRSARSLKTGKHHLIGVIAYDITDAFAVECIAAMEKHLENTHYRAQWISCAHAHRERAEPEQILGELAQSVDGIIVVEADYAIEDADLIRFCASTEMPVVTVIRKVPGDMISSVTIDDELSTKRLFTHLQQYGHREIAFCFNEKKHPTATRRHEVYLELLRTSGLTFRPEFQVPVDGDPLGGYQAGKRLIDAGTRPSAVIAYNDLTAIGLMKAFGERGLRLPDEMSIAAFDNIRISEFTAPSLTTMAANYPEIARLSVDQLIAQIEDAGSGRQIAHHVTEATLIPRQSIARPRQ